MMNPLEPFSSALFNESTRSIDAENARRLLALATFLQNHPDTDEPTASLSRRYGLPESVIEQALARREAFKAPLNLTQQIQRWMLELKRQLVLVMRFFATNPYAAASLLIVGTLLSIALSAQAVKSSRPEWAIAAAFLPALFFGFLLRLLYRGGSSATGLLLGFLWSLAGLLCLRAAGEKNAIQASSIIMALGLTILSGLAGWVGYYRIQSGGKTLSSALTAIFLARPYRAAFWAGIACTTLLLAEEQASEMLKSPDWLTGILATSALILYVSALFSISYANANIKKGFLLGLFGFVSFLAAAMTAALITQAPLQQEPLAAIIGLTVVVLIFVTPFIAVFSMMFAAFGNYKRALDGEREISASDRQSLLARLFELQERLHMGMTHEELWKAAAASGIRREAFDALVGSRHNSSIRAGWIDKLKQFWDVNPLTLVLFVTIFSGLSNQFYKNSEHLPFWTQFVAVMGAMISLFGALRFIVIFLTGFRLAQPGIGAICGFASALLTYAIWAAFPEQANINVSAGISHFFSPAAVTLALFALSMIFQTLLGAMGGALGMASRYSRRQRAIEKGESHALLAEIAQIQQQLSATHQSLTFLVVDVKNSTTMMAQSDPLSIEYTFSQYHRYVRQIVEEKGGQIHSTAGDGMIAAFWDAKSAWQSAKSIQSGITEFGTRFNRLPLPFQLRCGLHLGEVSVPGAVEEISFTHVLDVAAHIEKACPIGGIALTSQAQEHCLPDLPLRKLDEPIDNFEVFVAEAEQLSASASTASR